MDGEGANLIDKWFFFDENSVCGGDEEGGEFVLKADDGTFWGAYPAMRAAMQTAASRAAEGGSLAPDRAAAYRISVTHDEARCLIMNVNI